jgi:hypothetical protein
MGAAWPGSGPARQQKLVPVQTHEGSGLLRRIVPAPIVLPRAGAPDPAKLRCVVSRAAAGAGVRCRWRLGAWLPICAWFPGVIRDRSDPGSRAN